MSRFTPALLAILVAAALAVPTMASAKAKHRVVHHYRQPAPVMVYQSNQPPLTVNRRSWLDPGNVVPVGSESRYVAATTYFAQTPDQAYFPSRFHEDAMPRPLYVPGNMTPLVTFSTPRDLF